VFLVLVVRVQVLLVLLTQVLLVDDTSFKPLLGVAEFFADPKDINDSGT